MHRLTRLVLLTIVMLTVAAPDAGSARQGDDRTPTTNTTHENGLLVYQRSNNWAPEPGVVVADADGNELRQIETPVLRRLIATRYGTRALGRTPDGEVYLIDAEAGTARRLELPESVQGDLSLDSPAFADSGGTRWWLLGGHRSGLDLTYLVDLETGAVSDLSTIYDSVNYIYATIFSADDDYLLLAADTQAWLIPTGNPQQVRPLDGYFWSFSPDGVSIVYTRLTSNGYDVILERIADRGRRSEVVASSEDPIGARFSPDGGHLLMTRQDSVSLLRLADREEQELLSYAGEHATVLFSGDGSHIVIGYTAEGDDSSIWWLAHLDGSATTELSELHGTFPYNTSLLPRYAVDQARRWLFFVGEQGIAGAPVFGLDLTTGAVRRVFRMKVGFRSFSVGEGVASGRHDLLLIQSVDTTQLWLVDATGAEPRLLAEAKAVLGAFSPDGRWIAVSTLSIQNETRTAEVTLVATDGSATIPVGDGYSAVWLPK